MNKETAVGFPQYDSLAVGLGTAMQAITAVISIAVLAAILPATISAQTYFASQQYQGRTDPRTLDATDKLQHIVLANPWIAAYFMKVEPNGVEIKINDENGSPIPISPGETITIGRTGARERIYAIYYSCHAGETTTVSVIGEY